MLSGALPALNRLRTDRLIPERRQDMVMAHKSSRALLPALALIGLPALIAVALEAYNATSVAPKLEENQRLVSHTFEVIAAARSFDLAIGDAESAERGFIITGDNSYLSSYDKNVSLINTRLIHLGRLISDNPDQQRQFSVIETATEDRVAEMGAGILARQKTGFLAARGVLQSHLGADARHVISGHIDMLIARQNGLLAQRQATLTEFQKTNAAIDLLSIGLVFSLLVLGTTLLARAILREYRSMTELRRSEERFRLLVSGVRDYAIFMLDAEGKVASWNPGAVRIAGYREHEVIGKEHMLFYSPEEQASGKPSTELFQASRFGSLETEGWRTRKDGSRFYAQTILSALHADDGTLQGFATITRDVTERRAQEKALEESRAALVQAQKMEALGQLTGGMAHDFNNLLTVIIGSIELVRRAGVKDERAGELLDAAHKAGEQGASLVRRLLAFSRRQTLAPQSVDVNRLVTDMSELVRRTLGEGIALHTVLGGGVWRTLVDPGQLESALLNLAVNARDAMTGMGKLTIETGNTTLDEPYADVHGEVAAGEYVVVAVSDSGTGMSEETIARAFEPFFTTKPEGRGTGLGLSQVHGFVKQSGGHVAVYSELNLGTTVKMYLPRDASVEVSEASPAPEAPLHRANGETILLVEDEPLVRLYGSEALTELGYRVLEASDGNEAMRILGRHPEIAVLFTDIGLPGGLNGRQLADEARALMPKLKVLFATGYAKNAALNNGAIGGGSEHLDKPYSVEALARKLKQMTATDHTATPP
jgi:PAS domain S-box-containing protein